MNTLKEFIELEAERSALEEKIAPEKRRIHEINEDEQEFNDNLPLSVKNFIAEKLWEGFSSDYKEQVQEQRKKIEEMLYPPKSELTWNTSNGDVISSSYSIYSIERGPFDPVHDDWWIFSFEEKDDKMRICVSCKKNEGSISGLMTMLDAHWTVWFDKKEIENI